MRERERERESDIFSGREEKNWKKRCGENFKKSPIEKTKEEEEEEKEKEKEEEIREALLHYFGDQNIG